MSRILVIDDDPDILEQAELALTNAGHVVQIADDGDVAIDRLKTVRPHLILCDVRMPRVNGFEVLRAVRRDPGFAVAPFIFISTMNEWTEVRAAMNLGADDYLTKPFSNRDLLETVEARLAHFSRFRDRFEEKLEALRDSVLKALPHELRTPLTGVLGFSEILLEDLEHMERRDAEEMLSSIHASGKRLQRVVENFMLYVQLRESKTIKPLSPGDEPGFSRHDLIQEEAIKQADERGRVTDLSLSLEDVSAPVPPSFMRKICGEIIDNGFKFSDPGQRVEVRWFGSADTAVLQVTDNGRGMTPEQIASIGALAQFERDYHEQQGIGLGLATAHLLVRSYGGSIEVRSPGGTSVKAVLPRNGH